MGKNLRAKIPTIAIMLAPQLKGARSTFRGILDYAAAHGPWRLLFPEGRDGEQALDFGKIGCDAVVMSDVTGLAARRIASLGVPVVCCEPFSGEVGPGHPLARYPKVQMDSQAVGAMAASYFLGRGYVSFAYVGETQGVYWNAKRRAGFEETLRKAGFGAAVHDGPFSARERRDWCSERPRMIAFLNSLPRPAAVFAAMDGRARLVLDACLSAGLRVPEEIAVLGVDDDPIICESCVPSLSSIRTGGYRRGIRIASLLDDLMHGRPVPETVIVEEPLAVVTRGSTGYDAMRDPILARALSFIHANGATGRCQVADVAAAAGCSRRYLEKRFASMVGNSVRDIIIQGKIERAKSLLEKGTMPIGDIPDACGVSCGSHLAVLFKKATGMSMRDWRLSHHDAADL